VLAGVFAGLRITTETSWASAARYLSGVYEEELHASILEVVDARPPIVVNIGAAEGYYAVGLARLLPQSVIHAYDVDPEAQRALRRTVKLNGVTNVRVHGRVTTTELQRILVPGAFVLSDCEGYELALLDPQKVPALRTATVIAELHDMIKPATSDIVMRRFRATHEISLVDEQHRAPDELVQLGHLTPAEIPAALDEGRPGRMQWAVMFPRIA
jgi:hypothetical protein